MADDTITYAPVTEATLPELARFSEGHGKFRYCSCMRWRLTSGEFSRSTKEDRVAALDDRVRLGVPVGVLAFRDGEPVGWCSVAPRETLPALERYRGLPRVDAEPVWSVVCFFVDAKARRQGVTLGLLRAAVDYAVASGARIIEGYPVEPGKLYGYMGSPATFCEAGFREVAQHPNGRVTMRYEAAATIKG